eukprot:scaffold679265_cov47-Prasinocladus_malaysianus.AAC.1
MDAQWSHRWLQQGWLHTPPLPYACDETQSTESGPDSRQDRKGITWWLTVAEREMYERRIAELAYDHVLLASLTAGQAAAVLDVV